MLGEVDLTLLPTLLAFVPHLPPGFRDISLNLLTASNTLCLCIPFFTIYLILGLIKYIFTKKPPVLGQELLTIPAISLLFILPHR